MSSFASSKDRISLAQIKAHLNASPASALAFILPKGVLCGREFQCGDVHGAEGRSFLFNVEKLKGCDFSYGSDRGYCGVFDVYVAHCHGDAVAAILLAREFMGLSEEDRPTPKTEHLARPSSTGEWTAVTPIPHSAGLPDFRRLCPKDAKLTKAWPYRNEAGEVLFYVVRYDFENGEKKTPQISYGHDDVARLRFKTRKADLNILFGLEQLARRPDAPVLVVEGEKAAVVGRRMFPEFVVVSWVGGAKNVKHIDFSPLAGRSVVFLADADQPGELAMRQAETGALEAGATDTRVIVLSEEFGASKTGWDIADDLPEGWTVEQFKTLIGV